MRLLEKPTIQTKAIMKESTPKIGRTMKTHRQISLLSFVLFSVVVSSTSKLTTAKETSSVGEQYCEPYTLSVPSFVDDEIVESRNRHNNIDGNNNMEYPKKKMIIGHRGASFHVPQHTLISYNLALEIGSDYVEPDLVVTEDGYLIASHTVDLNITTTNVEEMANRWNKLPWFSPYANRSGFWAFNFTLEEIQRLHVKQSYPSPRTSLYDDVFAMPHLIQIQQLIQDWNTNRLPLIQNLSSTATTSKATILPLTTTTSSSSTSASTSTSLTESTTTATTTTTKKTEINNNNNAASKPFFTIRPTKVGLYAALKDVEWILQDTGMDLVDVLIKSIYENRELFEDVLTCHPRKYHHYSIPPLVIQSFDGQELKRFHKHWSELITDSFFLNTTTAAVTTAANNSDSNATKEEEETIMVPTTIPQSPPVPPMVLLVNRKECVEEDFWFTFGKEYHDIIEGIGPDKRCLLQENSERSVTTAEEEAAFTERVKEYDLVVHTWTERPELDEIDSFLGFRNLFDEVQYLFCHLNSNVHGIFVDMISTALLAANMPCPLPPSSNSGGAAAAATESSPSLDNSDIPSSISSSTTENKEETENNDSSSSSSSSSSASQQQEQSASDALLCIESEYQANVYVGLASFVMGVFLTGMISAWINGGNTNNNCRLFRRPPRRRHGRSRLPTEDEHELEDQVRQEQGGGEGGGVEYNGNNNNNDNTVPKRDLEML